MRSSNARTHSTDMYTDARGTVLRHGLHDRWCGYPEVRCRPSCRSSRRPGRRAGVALLGLPALRAPVHTPPTPPTLRLAGRLSAALRAARAAGGSALCGCCFRLAHSAREGSEHTFAITTGRDPVKHHSHGRGRSKLLSHEHAELRHAHRLALLPRSVVGLGAAPPQRLLCEADRAATQAGSTYTCECWCASVRGWVDRACTCLLDPFFRLRLA